jgi:hypothetical protein
LKQTHHAPQGRTGVVWSVLDAFVSAPYWRRPDDGRIQCDPQVRYAYTGNVDGEWGRSAFCPSCGARLVGRDRHGITEWNLQGGGCPACGEPCPEVFDELPGRSGQRRLPVPLKEVAA